jgi:hypothetical protein
VIHIQLSYILSVFILISFGISFFTYDYYVPYLKKWKARQLLSQSQVYLDPKIGSSRDLIKEGVRKANIAYLLNPKDPVAYDNYLDLLYLEHPAKALSLWSKLVDSSEIGLTKGNTILSKSLISIRDVNTEIQQKAIIGRIAILQYQYLAKIEAWRQDSQNLLLGAETLAETGNHQEALKLVESILLKEPNNAEAVFLLTRLTVHLQDKSQLTRLGQILAPLSSQRSEIGVEAIRHMTLLNFLQPLAPKSLDYCIELLSVNPTATEIDFLRIYAMRYAIEQSRTERSKLIKRCSEIFDLDDSNQLLVFGNWLIRVQAYEEIIDYIPVSRAKAEESFFKIRMAALAHVGDLEKIRSELNRASIIPSRWRLVVEARVYSMEQNFLESQKSLKRIIPLLGSDPREARAICIYLEQVKDIQSLCHLLEMLIDDPIHQRYAVSKLLQYQGASVSIAQLIEWSDILLQSSPDAPQIKRSNLYFKLLDPTIRFPSQRLIELTNQAKSSDAFASTMETQITLALAHLKSNSPSEALVALGKVNDWRRWETARSPWKLIASHVFKLNGDTEKFLILQQKVQLNELNQAEKESLEQIFKIKLG